MKTIFNPVERHAWAKRQFEWIKSQTVWGVRNISDLLAMPPQNDPFYCGQSNRIDSGCWFSEVWDQYGKPGMHLRRFHYALISQAESPRLPNGEPYENTERCWIYLQSGFANARYLGFVDPTAFTERRSAKPIIFTASRPSKPAPQVVPPALPGWALPTLDSDITLHLSGPDVNGYDYDHDDQPYLIELWIEKSTMNDVLLPICEHFGINLFAGLGFSSITRVAELLDQRVGPTVRPHA